MALKSRRKCFNAIAHINYQIRQSWKLLSWRLRLASFIGYYRSGKPPRFPVGMHGPNDDAKSFMDVPSTCVAHDIGWQWATGETWCDDEKRIPNISLAAVATSFGISSPQATIAAALALGAAELAEFTKTVGANTCIKSAQQSWRMVALYFIAYRLELAKRKKAIYLLAHNASRTIGREKLFWI